MAKTEEEVHAYLPTLFHGFTSKDLLWFIVSTEGWTPFRFSTLHCALVISGKEAIYYKTKAGFILNMTGTSAVSPTCPHQFDHNGTARQ